MLENHIGLAPREPSILDSQEKLLQLARKLENVYKERPDIHTFVGSMKGTKFEGDYSEEAIKRDEDYVKRTREKIEEENSSSGKIELEHIEGAFQLSEMLQTMVVDRLNKHWFKDITTEMTSDFDDLTVGMDAVMKHKKGGYLGLSFDFTVTNQDMKIYDKLEKEWDKNISKGYIPAVKYFADPDTKQKGRLLVPKFIIGASKKDVEDLANAYLNNDTELLENHPLKYVILLQIEEQIQTVLDFYETNEDPKFEFAKTQYERIQRLLRNMKREIHADEKIHENTDLYEYSKQNKALDMIRRFRIMREHKKTNN